MPQIMMEHSQSLAGRSTRMPSTAPVRPRCAWSLPVTQSRQRRGVSAPNGRGPGFPPMQHNLGHPSFLRPMPNFGGSLVSAVRASTWGRRGIATANVPPQPVSAECVPPPGPGPGCPAWRWPSPAAALSPPTPMLLGPDAGLARPSPEQGVESTHSQLPGIPHSSFSFVQRCG